MKMVKSLLLGTAAGLVAVASAQAADLPVKAKPVQYVKICSLYGAGFYYVPGTDICLKIGGYVRAQQSYNANGSQTNGPLVSNLNDRSTVDMAWRSRAYITADARQQTAYGTVRSYVSVGLSGDQAIAFSANRAFIQFAGFTVGTAVSFYDFYSSPAVSYFGGKIQPASDTGDAGQFVTAYTAQFGNGFSATISAEQPQQNRAQGVFNTTTATAATFGNVATPVSSAIGTKVPDFVANLRIDQAWGSAQIMGALHDASAQYYNPTSDLGHPGNRWGYALGAGLRLNAPMFGPGDYFQTQFNYSNGAIGYNIAGAAFRYAAYGDGKYGQGLALDGVYGGSTAAGGDIQLTKAWSVNASYEHFWNANWQTSLYGVYVNTKYNDAANALLCTAFGTTANPGNAALCAASGSFNWNYWAVGSRTQWNVNKNFYMGVDVVYSKLDQNMNGVANLAAAGTRAAGAYNMSDMSAWTAQFRVHRDFGF